jgi:iron complex outermembrane receptor protein
MDWELSTDNAVTVQGDYYNGDAGRRIGDPIRPDKTDISGGNVLGRWKRIFSRTADMAFQFYYDRTERNNASIGEIRDTLDVDFQNRFSPFSRHDFLWGLGYHNTTDDTDTPGSLSFDPESRSDNRFSAFIQDEITLIQQKLYLTPGSKFENNDYSGFEYQPSIKLSWTPTQKHTLWAAISRAVRTPSRIEQDQKVEITIPYVGPFTVVKGNPDYDSEELVAYELGYRIRPADRLSIDIATFYNVYDNLGTAETSSAGTATFENKLEAETYGIEGTVNWGVTDFWNLVAGYSFFEASYDYDESSEASPSKQALEKIDPRHKATFLSHVNLPHNIEFDTALYYVESFSVPSAEIPAYFRFDARLGWRPTKAVDLSIVLQNAFDDEHPEYSEGVIESSEIQRSIFGKITWQL